MKYKSNEQGQCPYCNSLALDYGVASFEDDNLVCYSWTCENCKHTGTEWYKMNFIGHNDEDGNIINVKECE